MTTHSMFESYISKIYIKSGRAPVYWATSYTFPNTPWSYTQAVLKTHVKITLVTNILYKQHMVLITSHKVSFLAKSLIREDFSWEIVAILICF